MPLANTILLFMGMLLLALVLEPVARRLRLPFSAALVVAGYLGATGLVALGMDTGLRWYHFHDLIFYVLLPVLIFESAFQMNARQLLRSLPLVLFMAVPLLLVSAALSAAILYFTIGHPSGFPWIAALLTGTLLAATDPVAVIELLRRLGIPDSLIVLLEGESLFNDATTIVLFSLLLGLAMSGDTRLDWASATLEFFYLFLGGVLAGAVTGLLAGGLLHLFRTIPCPSVITLMAAYVSYLAAEFQFHVSGVMAALACGLVAGTLYRRIQPERNTSVEDLWHLLGWIANTTMFLLAGATITLNMFQERWLAMLLGIAAVLVARWLTISATVLGTRSLTTAHQQLLVWGGLRGAVTLALALSLPVELEYWWTIQSIAYGVVLFTLFVQAPTVEPLLGRLRRQGKL